MLKQVFRLISVLTQSGGIIHFILWQLARPQKVLFIHILGQYICQMSVLCQPF